MKYYLVALFDDESYKVIAPLQKSLSKRYKLYKNIPTAHITLEIIDNPDIEKLDEILTKILKPYKKFKVELNDTVLSYENYKSINVNIENKGYIKRIARKVNDMLKLHNFSIRTNPQTWNLHIDLANSYYSQKDSKKADVLITQDYLNLNKLLNIAKIDRIELWKSSNNKKENAVLSYQLKAF